MAGSDAHDHYKLALEKALMEKGDVIMKLREMVYNHLADLQEKTSKEEDLSATFKMKARETNLTETAIKEEIKDIRERLEILQVVKSRERKKNKAE